MSTQTETAQQPCRLGNVALGMVIVSIFWCAGPLSIAGMILGYFGQKRADAYGLKRGTSTAAMIVGFVMLAIALGAMAR